MKKKIVCALLFLVFACCVTSVFADDLSDVKSAGELVLGTSPDYIPFVYYDEAGTLTGIDVALIEEVARRMGVKLKTVDLAFDGLMDSLELGQVDIIGCAFTKTEERAQRIDMTRIYYKSDAQMIALSSLAKSDKSGLESLRGMKIGVEKGTSFDQWIKSNLVSAGLISTRNVYTYSSAADAVKALDRGDVDLVLMDQDICQDLYLPTGKYKTYYDGIAQEGYAFGLRKGSTLTAVVNQHLTDMMKDGTAQSIANRFFQKDFAAASTSGSRSSQLPTPTPASPLVIPTAVPATCINSMSFVSDVTIVDGHQVYPGEQFRKTWRIINNGSCTWTSAYSFVYVSGDQMNGRNIYIPATVLPGQTIDLSVDMVAPYNDGTYRGYWQMRSPQGINFGQTIWAKVRVKGGWVQPTAAPKQEEGQRAVFPSFNYFYPDFYAGKPGDCPTVYWSANNTNIVYIKVDGNEVFSSQSASGAQPICDGLHNSGSHTIEMIARNVVDDAYSSFTYTTKEEDGQKAVFPSINSFSSNSYGGKVGECPTVSWSTANTNMVYITVDGHEVYNGSNANGSYTICSGLENVGNHTIELIARNVTDDTYSSFGYTTEP